MLQTRVEQGEDVQATTLGDVVQSYLKYLRTAKMAKATINSRKVALTSFIGYAVALGIDRLADVRPDLVSAYQEELRRTHSLRTVRDEVTILKVFSRWAHEHGLQESNPLCFYASPPKVASAAAPTSEQVERILRCCDPAVRAPFTTLAFSGIQQCELTNLAPEDVDLRHGWIYVRRATAEGADKWGAVRQVPIHPRLLPLLRQHNCDGQKWFFSFNPRTGSPGADDSFRARDLSRMFTSAVTAAGFSGFNIYSLRRFFRVFCLDNWIPDRVVLHWLGRCDSQQAPVYDVPSEISKKFMKQVPFGPTSNHKQEGDNCEH